MEAKTYFFSAIVLLAQPVNHCLFILIYIVSSHEGRYLGGNNSVFFFPVFAQPSPLDDYLLLDPINFFFFKLQNRFVSKVYAITIFFKGGGGRVHVENDFAASVTGNRLKENDN